MEVYKNINCEGQAFVTEFLPANASEVRVGYDDLGKTIWDNHIVAAKISIGL